MQYSDAGAHYLQINECSWSVQAVDEGSREWRCYRRRLIAERMRMQAAYLAAS
jgi:hypothetical protein